MLPQHDPLFMQAPADHEERKKVEGAKKRKKKNLPQATASNCNTLHSKTISSLHKCVLLFLFLFLN